MTTTQQVIEFALNEERYCIGIDLVSEVVRVDRDDVTAVPNSPSYVEGVVDLRGQTTVVVNPYTILNIPGELETFEQLIVLDGADMDGDTVAWLVEDVYRVSAIGSDAVEESPADRDGITGVVNRDDGFVIWTAPEKALG